MPSKKKEGINWNNNYQALVMKAASGRGGEGKKEQGEGRSVPGIYPLADCGHSHLLY